MKELVKKLPSAPLSISITPQEQYKIKKALCSRTPRLGGFGVQCLQKKNEKNKKDRKCISSKYVLGGLGVQWLPAKEKQQGVFAANNPGKGKGNDIK